MTQPNKTGTAREQEASNSPPETEISGGAPSPSELAALSARLRDTTALMAVTCRVDLMLWGDHSNACISAADALDAYSGTARDLQDALKEIEGLKALAADLTASLDGYNERAPKLIEAVEFLQAQLLTERQQREAAERALAEVLNLALLKWGNTDPDANKVFDRARALTQQEAGNG